jgi:hypothetical protein
MGRGIPPNNEVAPWWQTWQKSTDWQNDLMRRAAHKTLDIPEDMNITKVGIGPIGVVGAVLAAGIVPAVLAFMLLSGDKDEPVAPTLPPVVERPDTDTDTSISITPLPGE